MPEVASQPHSKVYSSYSHGPGMTLTSSLYFCSAFYHFLSVLIRLFQPRESLWFSSFTQLTAHLWFSLYVVAFSLPVKTVAWICVMSVFLFFLLAECPSFPQHCKFSCALHSYCLSKTLFTWMANFSFPLSFRAKNWQQRRRRKMLTCIVENEANCWMLNIVILYLHRKGTRGTY